MMRKLGWTFCVAISLFSYLGNPSSATGQLIAYDGFEDALYSGGEVPPLDGIPLQLSGALDENDDYGNPPVSPGWIGEAAESGAVSRKWVLENSLGFVYRTGSLSHSSVSYDDASTGKAESQLNNGSSANFRSIRRIIDDYQAADIYYMSFFVRTTSLATGELGQRGQALVGFTGVTMSESTYNNNVGANPIYGLMVGFDGGGINSRISNLVLRSRMAVENIETPQFTNTTLLAGSVANPGAPLNEQVSTLENVTHLIMLKLEVNANADSDLVTYWVNPANVTNEGMATATAQATGTIDTLAIDVNDRLTRLQVVGNRYEDRTFLFDEPRFGLDFYSVAGVNPPPGVIGDYNDDDIVNAADYAVWRDNLGGPAELEHDDTPGVNNQADYENWRANFGLEAQTGTGAVSVPEPATALLMLPLLVCLIARRARRAGR